MQRFTAVAVLALALLVPSGARGGDLPSDPPVETRRHSALRAVYFPFLAVGHGVLLVAKYGVVYPVWFVAKPVYDTLYESSEDPEALSRAMAEKHPSP